MLLLIPVAAQFTFTNHILRGLMSYYLIISGHRSVVTILSLIVVWDINRFNKELDENIEKFKNFNQGQQSSKDRFVSIEQILIKRDNILPGLNYITHYLIIDRILYLLFDFWNITCDKTKAFKIGALFLRHLFHFTLNGWIIFEMARFNQTWPSKLVYTVNEWRLRNWILKPLDDDKSKSIDLMEDETKEAENNDINDYFAKEFKLWDKFLTQYHFKKKFRFRLFEYNVDIRWFTISFIMQIVFALNIISKKWGNLKEWVCL